MGKWAEPELTFGFLAACLPVLPAFVKHVLRTKVGTRLRGLWTQSPLSDAPSSAARRVRTVGSGTSGDAGKRKTITKVVRMDIEFELLTAEEGFGTGEGASRASSRSRERERDEEWGGEGKGQASVWPLRT